MTHEHDQNSILIALKGGDHAAFRYFYDQYSLSLYRRLQRMVQSELIAQELLQELFLKIWEKREQIDSEQSFIAYLHRIAERLVYDHYRNLAREAIMEKEMILTCPEAHHAVEENMTRKEIHEHIHAVVNRLPVQQKRVFTLCKIEGYSYEEVSKLLGITTATVNTHITRALQTVRNYLLRNDFSNE